jgi:outer membrane protein assembly factor BamB
MIGALSGCSVFGGSDDGPRLKGERISVLEMQSRLEPDDVTLDSEGVITPDPWANDYWPQAGGYPTHSMQNLVFTADRPELQWSADIGAGSGRVPITAQPVIYEGRVYTQDAGSRVTAFDAKTGKRQWRKDLIKGDDEVTIPGGIGVSDGTLFATTGQDVAVALDAETGKEKWRTTLPAAARGGPTISNGQVFVITLDNRMLALDAKTGASNWQHKGLSATSGVIGTASPAANNDIVVPAYSSGEIYALRAANGSTAWTDNLASLQRTGGLQSLSDISAHPVIDDELVLAVSFGGRMVAINTRSGDRVWQREIGSSQMPWIAGNHIFAMTTNNELAAIGRDNGVIRWVKELPRFEDPGAREDRITWAGPVFAGGRLILAGSNGEIRSYAPVDGDKIRTWQADGNFQTQPVIAGGTLYLLSQGGTLKAYK